MPDTYFELVKEFPLVHIKSEDQLVQAQVFLDGLLRRDLDQGEEAYLEALTDLIEIYEEENEPSSDAPPEDVLRELISSSGLSQQSLAKAVGITQSTISGLLTGRRKMTPDHMTRFAKHFHVPASVFLPS